MEKNLNITSKCLKVFSFYITIYTMCPSAWKAELSSEICVPLSELSLNLSDSFLGNYYMNIWNVKFRSCNKTGKKILTAVINKESCKLGRLEIFSIYVVFEVMNHKYYFQERVKQMRVKEGTFGNSHGKDD